MKRDSRGRRENVEESRGGGSGEADERMYLVSRFLFATTTSDSSSDLSCPGVRTIQKLFLGKVREVVLCSSYAYVPLVNYFFVFFSITIMTGIFSQCICC